MSCLSETGAVCARTGLLHKLLVERQQGLTAGWRWSTTITGITTKTSFIDSIFHKVWKFQRIASTTLKRTHLFSPLRPALNGQSDSPNHLPCFIFAPPSFYPDEDVRNRKSFSVGEHTNKISCISGSCLLNCNPHTA